MRSAVSRIYEGKYDEPSVIQLAKSVHAELGQHTAACAFIFITEDYLPHLADFTELLRLHGHIVDIVGCTSGTLISTGTESETTSGFSLLVFAFDDAQMHLVELNQNQVDEFSAPDYWRGETGVKDPQGWVALLNPGSLNAEKWVQQWDQSFPEIPCIGGLASSSEKEEGIAVFHNDKIVDGIAVGFTGNIKVIPALSQGCRPIGEPLPVTRADANVIFSLGARPAYEALESAFNTLEESEKAEAKGNLLAGLAATEYVEEFKAGDFVVRNILGADPKSGAVAIGGFPRLGQTVQYQYRSREAADKELHKVLEKVDIAHKPLASLVFSCNGRRASFFGQPNHDAVTLSKVVGDHPLAGFFCSGEIGAASGKKSGIHGYTASAALFI